MKHASNGVGRRFIRKALAMIVASSFMVNVNCFSASSVVNSIDNTQNAQTYSHSKIGPFLFRTNGPVQLQMSNQLVAYAKEPDINLYNFTPETTATSTTTSSSTTSTTTTTTLTTTTLVTSTDKKDEPCEEVDNSISEEESIEAAPTYTWNGPVLNSYAGTVQGPSGKETFYNLPMGGVVSIMQSLGYNYSYWVREDGAKMYGDYIMCAANLNVHPRGSLVETSMGTAIVCDTGGFAYSNSTQLDIATTW